MNKEQLNAIFQDAEEHLMIKSILVGAGPQSMVGVTLTPEEYEDGMKCFITVECSQDEELDEDTLDLISVTVSEDLRENWDLDERLTEIGIDPEKLDWWPVDTKNVWRILQDKK